MSSQLAQQFVKPVVQRQSLFDGKSRKFFMEICRCLPFIQKIMRLEEMVTVAEMRSVVKQQFKQYTNVSNEKVVDLLIFKGREELETFLTLHKQRHHIITQYLEPVLEKKRMALLPQKPSTNSAFLDSFLETKYSSPLPASK